MNIKEIVDKAISTPQGRRWFAKMRWRIIQQIKLGRIKDFDGEIDLNYVASKEKYPDPDPWVREETRE